MVVPLVSKLTQRFLGMFWVKSEIREVEETSKKVEWKRTRARGSIKLKTPIQRGDPPKKKNRKQRVLRVWSISTLCSHLFFFNSVASLSWYCDDTRMIWEEWFYAIMLSLCSIPCLCFVFFFLFFSQSIKKENESEACTHMLEFLLIEGLFRILCYPRKHRFLKDFEGNGTQKSI